MKDPADTGSASASTESEETNAEGGAKMISTKPSVQRKNDRLDQALDAQSGQSAEQKQQQPQQNQNKRVYGLSPLSLLPLLPLSSSFVFILTPFAASSRLEILTRYLSKPSLLPVQGLNCWRYASRKRREEIEEEKRGNQ